MNVYRAGMITTARNWRENGRSMYTRRFGGRRELRVLDAVNPVRKSDTKKVAGVEAEKIQGPEDVRVVVKCLEEGK